MAFIGKIREGEGWVMTKRRPIDKKGKLNIQWFPFKKKRRKNVIIFNYQLSSIQLSMVIIEVKETSASLLHPKMWKDGMCFSSLKFLY